MESPELQEVEHFTFTIMDDEIGKGGLIHLRVYPIVYPFGKPLVFQAILTPPKTLSQIVKVEVPIKKSRTVSILGQTFMKEKVTVRMCTCLFVRISTEVSRLTSVPLFRPRRVYGLEVGCSRRRGFMEHLPLGTT